MASARKHGIKSYRVDADRTDISFNSYNVRTEGIHLTRGTIHGVNKATFKGTQRSVRFK